MNESIKLGTSMVIDRIDHFIDCQPSHILFLYPVRPVGSWPNLACTCDGRKSEVTNGRTPDIDDTFPSYRKAQILQQFEY